MLLVGEQTGTGVQGPPSGIERVAFAAAVPTGVLLDPSAALVQRVAGQAWKGSITATASGSSWVVAVLNPVNPSIATTSSPSRQDFSAFGQALLERLLRAALHHVQQPRWSTAAADRGQVDDDGHLRVAAAGVAHDVFIHPDHRDTLEATHVIDEDTAPFSQDRAVRGVPRHPETFGDPDDGQMLAHDALQRPPQTASGELRPRLGRAAGVLAPHVPALAAPVAADPLPVRL